ncbi:hypothetical protein KI387_041614, partial [Taxus chinensis]
MATQYWMISAKGQTGKVRLLSSPQMNADGDVSSEGCGAGRACPRQTGSSVKWGLAR